MSARPARFRAGDMLLALALLGALIGKAEAADVQPASTSQPDWVISSDPSKSNWRAQDFLDQQQNAKGKSQPTGGEEETIIINNYQKSLGKGGAGAPLPPRDSEGQSPVEK